MKIREAKKDELVPVMLIKHKPVKSCDPDFFIINVSHGVPKTNKFAYIKRSFFPVENRGKGQVVNFNLSLVDTLIENGFEAIYAEIQEQITLEYVLGFSPFAFYCKNA